MAASVALRRARKQPTASRIWNIGWKCLCVFSIALLLFGVAGLWAMQFSVGWAQNAPGEWSDGRAPELEALVRKRCIPYLRAGKSVGLTVGVVTPTRATLMAFGRTSVSGSRHVSGDTLFELGSITKTFTGLALAREIEHGRVRLDQPIQELLPPAVELPVDARDVTLQHLVTHTSGFPRLPGNESLVPAFRLLLFGSDPYAGYTEADLMAAVRTVKLEFNPGARSSYSNFGMTLLGALLSTRAGRSYETLIKQEVCQPLGMRDTTVTVENGHIPRMAQGYRALWRSGPLLFGLRSNPWFESNHLGGAGALRSTGADMLKYLQVNMRPEDQPLEHALRESHRELFNDEKEGLASGMGWVRMQGQTLKQTIIWHNGGTGGFSSYVGFAERSGVGVVVLSNVFPFANTSGSVDDLSGDLLRDLAALGDQQAPKVN